MNEGEEQIMFELNRLGDWLENAEKRCFEKSPKSFPDFKACIERQSGAMESLNQLRLYTIARLQKCLQSDSYGTCMRSARSEIAPLISDIMRQAEPEYYGLVDLD